MPHACRLTPDGDSLVAHDKQAIKGRAHAAAGLGLSPGWPEGRIDALRL